MFSPAISLKSPAPLAADANARQVEFFARRFVAWSAEDATRDEMEAEGRRSGRGEETATVNHGHWLLERRFGLRGGKLRTSGLSLDWIPGRVDFVWLGNARRVQSQPR